MTQTNFPTVLPEIILAAFAMIALLFAVYTGKDKTAPLLMWVTAGLYLALAAFIGLRGNGTSIAFDGMFVDDAFARFAKVVILLSAAGVLVMSQEYMARQGLARFEYPILVTL